MENPSKSYEAVKFHIITGHFCLLCLSHRSSALLGKWVCSFYLAYVAGLTDQCAWGSVSDLHSCSGFRCSKKAEKHCRMLTSCAVSTWCTSVTDEQRRRERQTDKQADGQKCDDSNKHYFVRHALGRVKRWTTVYDEWRPDWTLIRVSCTLA